MEEACTSKCISCDEFSRTIFKFSGKKILENKFILDFIKNICYIKNENWYLDFSNQGLCRPCFTKLEKFYSFSIQLKHNLELEKNCDSLKRVKQMSPTTNTEEPLKRRKLIFSPINDHGYSSKSISNTGDEMLIKSKPNSKEREEKIKNHIQTALNTNRMAHLQQEMEDVRKNSILSNKRPIQKLQDSDTDLVLDIVEELIEKVPFLFEVIVTAIGRENCIAPISAIYGIIGFQRNHMMSAWQRCMSSICLRGQLEDSALIKMSQFGITLSPSSKLRLEEEACTASKKLIIEMLRVNPLAKITGDNLDVYIRRDILSSSVRNKDIHLFASNIIFPRIANIFMENTTPTRKDVSVDSLFLNENQRKHLLNLYKDIIADIFAKNIPGCEWMSELKRTQHEYSDQMAKKSIVAQLPIMNANEAKHEDCLKIMDEYEKVLTELYTEAHGNDDKLKKYRAVIGGDQLTRSRLQEAKALRYLSPNRKMRFDDLYPIVVELWHVKQDLLEKLYKALYSASDTRTSGSLAFFKAKLQRTDVSGKVKGHFKSHMEFFELIGERVLIEQGKQFFKSFDISDLDINDEVERYEIMSEIFDNFLIQYKYLPPVFDHGLVFDTNDEMFNYFNNLSHWFLHIRSLNKVAKDGDITRIIPNLLLSLPLFYNHSCLSKYLVECINYILYVENFLSPLMKLRVLEGSFVNVKGGKGNNVESDLLQEHAVRNQKTLIKQLGANKNFRAIERASGAAGSIAAINTNIAKSLGITPKSSRHVKTVSQQDKEIVSDVLSDLEPFKFTPGRKFGSFGKLGDTVFACIDGTKMKLDFDIIIKRLLNGSFYFENECVDDSNDSDSDNDDLPDL